MPSGSGTREEGFCSSEGDTKSERLAARLDERPYPTGCQAPLMINRYLCMPRATRVAHAMAGALLATSLMVAGASEVRAAPNALASVTIDGHGNGHGYGLSQWGAYGYAVDHGWTWTQILDHYYGGTVAGTVPVDSMITVRLQNLDDAQTAVVSEAGGLVVDGVSGGPWKSVLVREVAAGTYRVWARTDAQVCPGASGDPATSGWAVVADSIAAQVNVRTQADSYAATSYADLAAVCQPDGKIRSYRGVIRAINDANGANRTVNEVRLEHYLRAVIAKEMSPSWATAGGGAGVHALRAQAVAARSFGLAENRYSYAKTCDSVCQFYSGAATRTSVAGSYTRVEYPATDGAVTDTAGVVRRVGSPAGQIALTMFAASSGGYTAPGPGGLVPFPAVPDEGDDTALNPSYNWAVTLTAAQVQAKYPAVGTFSGLTVLTRNGFGDWGGRVLTIRVEGSAGSTTVSGDSFKSAFGLKSNLFTVRGSVTVPACDGRQPPAVTGAATAAPAAGYTPLAPARLADTRIGLGTADLPLGAGCTLVVEPAVSASATAVAVNITAIRPGSNGWVTAYACGTERPTVSVVQAVANRAVAGMAVVPLAADGRVCIYSSVAMEVAVDLFGWYGAGTGSGFEPMQAVRLRDTRSGAIPAAGTVLEIPVVTTGGAPAGATAAALTLHATNAAGTGYATVYPCAAQPPVVSSLNTVTGSSVTNHVQVALDGSGRICVFVSTAMHVVVDLSGWFGAAASTQFFAVPPFRAVDTRTGVGLSGAFSAGANRAVTLAGSGGLPSAATLRAVMAEATAVAPGGVGYLTVHPCLPAVPSLSMVRYATGANAANPVAAPDDPTGRWCIAASAATHVLVDVSGYFA